MSPSKPLQKLQALEVQGRKLVEHIGALESADRIGAAHERCERRLQLVIHQQIELYRLHENRQALRLRPIPTDRRDQTGIPTWYGDIRYRSRLEARWACWFEIAGIYAEYEPLDLEGYIPDFLIPDEWCGDLLVEVKPGLHARDLRPATQKVDDSGWEGRAVIVGAQFGVALERDPEPFVDGTWEWRPSRGFDVDLRMARRVWNEAGNRVQWKGRG